MHDSHIQGMASAIMALIPGADQEKILTALNQYWRDKIADIWDVDDLVGWAVGHGYLIALEQAKMILGDIEDHIDAELGITWMTIECAVLENCSRYLDQGQEWSKLCGAFWVIKPGGVITATVGHAMDYCATGNLSLAVEEARKQAAQAPGTCFYVAMAESEDPNALLSVCQDPDSSRPAVCVNDGMGSIVDILARR